MPQFENRLGVGDSIIRTLFHPIISRKRIWREILLHADCRTASSDWISLLSIQSGVTHQHPPKNSLKIIHNSVLYLSSLTLEIYIVQFDLITDKFNAVFPLNTIVIFSIICIAAYALRILTSLCLQTLSDNPYNIKQALRLF